MRKKIKRFRVLIFALSVLMFFCLAYLPNDGFGEIRFLSPNLALGIFETADQVELVVDPPAQSKGIVSASSLNLSYLGIHPVQNSFSFPSQPFYFEQNISTLRGGITPSSFIQIRPSSHSNLPQVWTEYF